MIFLISYAIFCIILAADNANRIKDGKRIYHALNGGIHIAAAIAAWIIYDWKMALCVLLTARIVFDTALNLFRGLPLFYSPLAPKSIVDKVEKWAFGSEEWIPKVIYLTGLILLLIL